MKTIPTNDVWVTNKRYGKLGCTCQVLLALSLVSACASNQLPLLEAQQSVADSEQAGSSNSKTSEIDLNQLPPNDDSSTQQIVLPDPSSAPRDPKEFALDLIELMGATPGKCGEAAANSPHVNWTCAEYTEGLATFIAKWDKLTTSAEVTLDHSYIATSDWMYFAIDGEIDFFWKTYDLETTQALVSYDPSELGNELIIGLNPDIGDQIAAANGSHSFTGPSKLIPVQD